MNEHEGWDQVNAPRFEDGILLASEPSHIHRTSHAPTANRANSHRGVGAPLFRCRWGLWFYGSPQHYGKTSTGGGACLAPFPLSSTWFCILRLYF